MEAKNKEPNVTVTGTTSKDDKVIFTLLNGKVGQVSMGVSTLKNKQSVTIQYPLNVINTADLVKTLTEDVRNLDHVKKNGQLTTCAAKKINAAIDILLSNPAIDIVNSFSGITINKVVPSTAKNKPVPPVIVLSSDDEADIALSSDDEEPFLGFERLSKDDCGFKPRILNPQATYSSDSSDSSDEESEITLSSDEEPFLGFERVSRVNFQPKITNNFQLKITNVQGNVDWDDFTRSVDNPQTTIVKVKENINLKDFNRLEGDPIEKVKPKREEKKTKAYKKKHYQKVRRNFRARKDINYQECGAEEKSASESESESVIRKKENLTPKIKPVECFECGKQLKSERILKRHMELHSSNKRNVCHLCNKAYTQRSQLNVHMHCVHEGRRDYECVRCGKFFAYKSALRVHLAAHIGIKKYECPVCKKKFVTNSHAHRHVRIMHNEPEEHKCTKCGKVFGFKEYLSRHMLFHSESKKYTCKICHRGFNEKQNFKSHKRCYIKIHVSDASML